MDEAVDSVRARGAMPTRNPASIAAARSQAKSSILSTRASTCVLRSLIPLDNNAIGGPALLERHLQCVTNQLGAQKIGHRPGRRWHERDVGAPELIRTRSGEVAVDDVGRGPGSLSRLVVIGP